MYCQRTVTDGGVVVSVSRVDDAECTSASLPQPMSERLCDHHCEYDVSFWSRCPVTCGTGIQTRRVGCLKTLPNGRRLAVDLVYCVNDSSITEPLPPSDRECATEICTVPPFIRSAPSSPPPPPPDTDLDFSVRQDVRIIWGRTLTIDCIEIQAVPDATMQWTLQNGVSLQPGQSFGRYRVTENATLIISNVTLGDQGLYSCSATNVAGRSIAYSTVTVYRELECITYS